MGGNRKAKRSSVNTRQSLHYSVGKGLRKEADPGFEEHQGVPEENDGGFRGNVKHV